MNKRKKAPTGLVWWGPSVYARAMTTTTKPNRPRRFWQREAACLNSDRDFIEETGRVQKKTLKEICADCPVRLECLDHGVVHEKFGTWGGKDERELAAIRRRSLESLGYQALVDGWLEEDNLIPPGMMTEIRHLKDLSDRRKKTQADLRREVARMSVRPQQPVESLDLVFQIDPLAS